MIGALVFVLYLAAAICGFAAVGWGKPPLALAVALIAAGLAVSAWQW